jgi:D-sedoheptulose 7-phosphate isomerase
MNEIDKFYTRDVAEFSKSYFSYLGELFKKIDLREIQSFVDTLLSAREAGSLIFFMGNGGSAATASHFANDLAIGVNDYEKPFKVMSITENIPMITAISNDYGYEEIFLRQLKVYGKSGDILVGISASGNSKNLINAFEYASSAEIKTVALTAFDGGKMKEIADQGIHIPTGEKEYGPAEDLHMILDHLVGSYLTRLLKM